MTDSAQSLEKVAKKVVADSIDSADLVHNTIARALHLVFEATLEQALNLHSVGGLAVYTMDESAVMAEVKKRLEEK